MNVLSPEKIIRRQRLFGIGIISIIVLPMILAYVMFHTGWGVSLSTTNKGELMNPPLSLNDMVLSQSPSLFNELYQDAGRGANDTGKKWRLLVPVTASCATACEQNLYLTRQVHIRLAEKAYRVERILLSLETLPQQVLANLDAEHRNTVRAQASLDEFRQWLKPASLEGSVEDYYYLVDQEGYTMMHYHSQHSCLLYTSPSPRDRG